MLSNFFFSHQFSSLADNTALVVADPLAASTFLFAATAMDI